MTDLQWRENALPVSTRFDDPYYSKEDGQAETNHVFIEGNRLLQRWPEMETCTIAELGFGTGLNFLETVRQWRSCKNAGAHLKFISFEQYPMQPDEMARALSNWPNLASLAEALVEKWHDVPPRTVIEFDGNITLEVHIADANLALPELSFLSDAWYLDGFSPAKNPELWNADLLAEVARHTVVGGTFATYTAAGFVRRNLQQAGFEVSKVKGFGRKRDMLAGKLSSDIDVA